MVSVAASLSDGGSNRSDEAKLARRREQIAASVARNRERKSGEMGESGFFLLGQASRKRAVATVARVVVVVVGVMA